MATYNGKKLSKTQFLSLVGHPDQIAYARPSVLSGGKSAGVQAVEIDTGGGVRLTVLPGRGMDIAQASVGSFPVAFMSATGITSPAYYEEPGLRWTRNFFGGLLTTCGIVNAGAPGPDGEDNYGLHGRVSNSGADDVCVSHQWDGDEYLIEVQGTVREAAAMAENMSLHRSIRTELGRKGFTLTDTVSNNGFEAQPLMMLYHCNFGWPLLSPSSRVIGGVTATRPHGEEAAAQDGVAKALEFHEPQEGYQEKVFFHDMAASEDGRTMIALVNPDRGDGLPLGVAMRYSIRELGCLTEWKMLRRGFYVVGLEPGTVAPLGRGALRRLGELPLLPPQESRSITIEYQFLDTPADLAQVETEAAALTRLSGRPDRRSGAAT